MSLLLLKMWFCLSVFQFLNCNMIARVAFVMATRFKPLGFFSRQSLDFAIDSIRKSLVDLLDRVDLLAFKVRVFFKK